jgi:hypothetical protein
VNESVKKEFPSFKEKLILDNGLEKTKISLKELIAKMNVTDDDYFLDKTDSLVFTYLMKENVNIYSYINRIKKND